MINAMKGLIQTVSGAVFGWRKLGVLIGMLIALFAWLFMITMRTAPGQTVSDFPPTLAGTLVVLYLTFVVGNWGEHKARARAARELGQDHD